ncbi:hypothetical protein LINPERHAP1_LOCUS16160 [Linum perenne]
MTDSAPNRAQVEMLRAFGLEQMVEDRVVLATLKASVASPEAKCEKWEARLKYVDSVLMRWPATPVNPMSAPSSTGKRKEQATDKEGVVGEKVSTTEDMVEGNEHPRQL